MPRYILVVLVMAGLLTSCGFKRKKYDNPITKDTKQPDKVLYDKAIADIEHSRFEIARITLNTLINTYDQSEFLAKAKLAEMELAVPEADPVAVNRMQWEAENRQKQGILPKYTSFLAEDRM